MTRIVEPHGERGAAGLFFDAAEPVLRRQTAFQEITVFENANFGTVLLLDGLVMTTDVDAPYYHEPLVHPALTAHPKPERVLIIGGGDGGTATEICRYPDIVEIVMVEIDPEVVEISRQYFPELSRGLDDPRLRLIHADGAAWVSAYDGPGFDAIVVDGSDPVGPAKVLFSSAFLGRCSELLRGEGIFVTQSESPLYFQETIRALHRALTDHFAWASIYSGTVPTYPGGLWTWSWAGSGIQPQEPRRETPEGLRIYDEGSFPNPKRNPVVVKELLP